MDGPVDDGVPTFPVVPCPAVHSKHGSQHAGIAALNRVVQIPSDLVSRLFHPECGRDSRSGFGGYPSKAGTIVDIFGNTETRTRSTSSASMNGTAARAMVSY